MLLDLRKKQTNILRQRRYLILRVFSKTVPKTSTALRQYYYNIALGKFSDQKVTGAGRDSLQSGNSHISMAPDPVTPLTTYELS